MGASRTKKTPTTGEVVSGRFVHDLPNKKIADIEKHAQSAYCLPVGCLQEVHDMVLKDEQKVAADECVECVESAPIVKSKEKKYLLFREKTECFQ